MTSNGPEQDPAAGAVPPPPAGPPMSQPPASWAWAQGQQVPLQTVETEPLEYHRLLRGIGNYRWWKPLVMLLLAGVYFGVFTVVVTLAMTPLLMLDFDYLTGLADGTGEVIDTQRPVSILLAMGSIIIMIPSVILAMLTMGMRPTGRVWSVAGKLRWGLLGKLLGAALLGVIAMNVVSIGIGLILDPGALGAPAEDVASPNFDMNAALVSLALVIVLVPFQAAAEEVVFRGLFMQVIGSWLKNPWFGILIPTILFALAHIYDLWGLAAVALMGAVAAWLAWRTGGLEAAIAIHVVNNLIAFGFMTFAVGGETAQTESAGGPEGVVGEIVGLGLFAWLTVIIFRRGGYGRARIDQVQVPAPQGMPPQFAGAGDPAAQPGAQAPTAEAAAGTPDTDGAPRGDH